MYPLFYAGGRFLIDAVNDHVHGDATRSSTIGDGRIVA